MADRTEIREQLADTLDWAWKQAAAVIPKEALLKLMADAVLARFPQLGEREQWIKIGSHPESTRILLVLPESQQVVIGFQISSFEWCDEGGQVRKWKPTLWRPLPDPPEVRKEKTNG